MQSINDIKHGFYINLQERSDRKLHLEAQLALMGLANNGIERFNAIKLANGAIGCSMSHLKCLELAKERSWDHVLILEDDIKFLNPALFKVQCSAFLRKRRRAGRRCQMILFSCMFTGSSGQSASAATILKAYRSGIRQQ